jgi:hypothetical protein
VGANLSFRVSWGKENKENEKRHKNSDVSVLNFERTYGLGVK